MRAWSHGPISEVNPEPGGGERLKVLAVGSGFWGIDIGDIIDDHRHIISIMRDLGANLNRPSSNDRKEEITRREKWLEFFRDKEKCVFGGK